MFKSLSSRISFLVFSIVISFNLVLMTIFYLALEKKSKEHFKKSIDTITNSIPNYYQIPLWNLDTKVIMEITEAFLKDKTIKGIQVIDIDSSILYQKFSDGDNATSLFNTPLIEIRKIPIIHTNSNSLGIIQVFFSSKNYHDENRAIILRMITVFSLFSFLIVFALYYILNNFLRNPLVILLKAIASTEKTQYSVRIHQNFPAELGQIATEFNKAMEKVQESENKLLSQNQNLEYLVSERTHQLDEQRAQMIKITDSGHGIPATIQTKMMNPFFTTKEVGKGTGLGLSISLGIIKNHGGEFYYNKEAKNTQFIIKLPINEHLSQAI